MHKRLLIDTIALLGGSVLPLLSAVGDIAVMGGRRDAAYVEPPLPISPAAITKSDSGFRGVAYLGIHAVQMRMRMKVLNTMRMHVHAIGCYRKSGGGDLKKNRSRP